MLLKLKRIKEITPYLVIFVTIFIFSILLSVVNQISRKDSLWFILFQVIMVIVPGVALTLLLGLKNISKIEFCGISYALGYAYDIVFYYLFIATGLKSFIIPVGIIIFLLSIFIICRYKKNYLSLNFDKKGMIICFTFIFLLLVMQFFLFGCYNILPMRINGNTYYSDLLYWIGDAIELSRQYPPLDFRQYGQTYAYHYFSSMQLAVGHLFTGVSVAKFALCFSFIQPIFLLVFSTYILLKQCIKRYSVIIMAMIAFFFTCGNEGETLITFISHTYKAPFGSDISMAFQMIALFFLIQQTRQEKLCISYCAGGIFSLAICLGSKGPYGSILLVGIGVFCIYQLFKKNYKVAFTWGILALITFFTLYKAVLSAPPGHHYNAIGRMSFKWFQGIIDYDVSLQLYGSFASSVRLPEFITEILYIPYYCIISGYAVFLPFLLGLILKFARWKSIEKIDISLISMIFVGIALFVSIKTYGRSQIYFMLAVWPAALVMGYKQLDCLLDLKRVQKKRSYKTGILAAYGSFLVLGLYTLLNNDFYFMEPLKRGAEIFFHPSVVQTDYNTWNYISNRTFAGYEWIRDNTEKDALLVSDTALGHTDTKPVMSYVVGDFCERRVWQTDLELIRNLMNNDKYALKKVKDLEVDYIIQTKWISPDFSLSRSDGKIIYENEEIIVYKILP